MVAVCHAEALSWKVWSVPIMQLRYVALVLLVVVVGLGAAAEPSAAMTTMSPGGVFFDDDGHPAEAYIEAAVSAGYLEGCQPAHPERFCPTQAAGRGEIERGIARVVSQTARLSCQDPECASLSVPASSVISTFRSLIPLLSQLSADEIVIDRAGLATALSAAGNLELRDVPFRRSFRIAATGDILPHSPVMAQAARNDDDGGFDFRPMFADIEPIIAGVDLGLCHLETPLSSDNTSLSSYPVFFSPNEVAEAVLAAGYDGCSTASNHSFDKRTNGVISTLGVIDDAGLGHAGTTDSGDDPSSWMYDVAGVKVAHLSYTYGLNGFRLPADQPWLVNVIDEDRILTDAAELRESGAEFIAVSLHWGNEYQSRPSGYQQGIAETLLESTDVDVIIGHHAHVVQAVDVINDKYVLYGLGNLISNQFFSLPTQDGVIAIMDVVEGIDGFYVADLEFIPTQVERSTYRIVPIPHELALELSDQGRTALEQSWERTTQSLSLIDETIADLVMGKPR